MKNRRLNMKKPSHYPKFSIQLAVCISLLSIVGCATLPDLSGYTAATDQLRQSVKSTGDAVSTEIDIVSLAFKESGGDDAAVQKLEKSKKDFEKHWADRNKAMTAIVGYAGSLEEITNSGKEGKESAIALGNSVENLLKTIGVIPGAQIAGVAKETIAFIYDEVAKVKAQNALDESIRKTGPIMEKIVEIIEKDYPAMKNSFEIAINAQMAELNRNNESVRANGQRDEWRTLWKYRNKVLLEELKSPDSQWNSQKIKDLAQDISVIDKRLFILNPEWEVYRKNLQDLQKRRRVGLRLIQASSKALVSWKNTHAKLANAVKKKKTPSVHEVAAAAADIQSLIKKWGEL